MARVTSEKTRQYRFVVDDAMEDGIPVDNIALFLPDGTPIDLTADPSKMKWMGTWSALSSYVLNDVVFNNNGLYILTDDSIVAGQPAPSTPNASWQLIFVAPPGGGFKGTFDAGTTYPAGSVILYNGSLWATDIAIPSGGNPPNEVADAISRTLGIAGARTIGRYTGPTGWTGASTTDSNNNAYRYFELLVGGTVTFTGGLFAGWDNAGTFTYTNFSGAKTLTAGLWIFSCQGGPGSIALSGGAVIKPDSAYPANWKLLTKPELPVGGATDDLLAKASALDRDVKWLTRPVPSRDTRSNRLSATPSLGRLWRDTDTGITYIGDGTNWLIFSAYGEVRRTSDFTLPQSDTTISGGDQIISFPAEANSIWIVEALLRLQGVSNLADVKFDFGITTGTYEMLSGLDALGVPAAGSPVAVSGATPIEFGLLNGTTFARLQALIMLGSGAQTVSLRGAQVTSQAENVKVLTNSTLLLRRLA